MGVVVFCLVAGGVGIFLITLGIRDSIVRKKEAAASTSSPAPVRYDLNIYSADGRFLIEHLPCKEGSYCKDDSYWIYDLDKIVDGFGCRTQAEAIELCARIAARRF